MSGAIFWRRNTWWVFLCVMTAWLVISVVTTSEHAPTASNATSTSDQTSAAGTNGAAVIRAKIPESPPVVNAADHPIHGRFVARSGLGEQSQAIFDARITVLKVENRGNRIVAEYKTDGNGESAFELQGGISFQVVAETPSGRLNTMMELPIEQADFDRLYGGVIVLEFFSGDAALLFKVTDPYYTASAVSILASYSSVPEQLHWFQEDAILLRKHDSVYAFESVNVSVLAGMVVYWGCYDAFGRMVASGCTNTPLLPNQTSDVGVALPASECRRLTLLPSFPPEWDRPSIQAWLLNARGQRILAVNDIAEPRFTIDLPVGFEGLLVPTDPRIVRLPIAIPSGHEDLELPWKLDAAGSVRVPAHVFSVDERGMMSAVVFLPFSTEPFLGMVTPAPGGEYYEILGGWLDTPQILVIGRHVFRAAVEPGAIVTYPSTGVELLGTGKGIQTQFFFDLGFYPVAPITVLARSRDQTINSQVIAAGYGLRTFSASMVLPAIPIRLEIWVDSEEVWSMEFPSPKDIPFRLPVR